MVAFPTPGAHAAVEVKGVRENADEIAQGKQVRRYFDRYGQILVTNYREFVLVTRNRHGELERIESFTLAADADAF